VTQANIDILTRQLSHPCFSNRSNELVSMISHHTIANHFCNSLSSPDDTADLTANFTDLTSHCHGTMAPPSKSTFRVAYFLCIPCKIASLDVALSLDDDCDVTRNFADYDTFTD
jgi:hypothetical protein